MLAQERKTKYILYARKSSESEDRQVQSIQDQIDRLKELAKSRNLRIVKIFKESHSAKQPATRPLFAEMLSLVRDGKADGILCWQINRLSRNPVDSGEISWLLQSEVLKSVQTIDKEYRPEDNVLLFNVESGVANQFILDLKKNTRRGLESKVQKGGCPYRAPAGYMNDRLNKTIVKDPERFDIIKKMWDLFARGSYSSLGVLKILNTEWGYTSRKTKRGGGNKMAQSEFYRILNNPFYYGYFSYNGELHKGNYDAMISKEQFDRVQELLGNKRKQRPRTHEFSYTGLMRCGNCGASITAEEKRKFVKSEGVYRTYTYYRCTRRKNGVPCSESSIKLPELETQIKDEIEKFTIHPGFKDWALGVLQRLHDEETAESRDQYIALEKRYSDLQKLLSNLTEMRLKEMIDDGEFSEKKAELSSETNELKAKLDQNHDRSDNWHETMDKAFTFAVKAREAFEQGDIKTKREIFSTLGQNFTLKDQKLTIKPVEWLIPLYQESAAINKHFSRLELNKDTVKQNKNTSFEKEMSLWGG